jgi:hypothetical protein
MRVMKTPSRRSRLEGKRSDAGRREEFSRPEASCRGYGDGEPKDHVGNDKAGVGNLES